MNEDAVSIAVTGFSWMGSGIGSIETAIERLFREASEEVALTAYAVTTGADLLLDWMTEALDRGVRVSMVVNRLEDQASGIGRQLRVLAVRYPHFRLYNFAPENDFDLHAKVIVVDRRMALVGSSNLSRRGLLNNHELAMLVEGPVATDVAKALDLLLTRAVPVAG